MNLLEEIRYGFANISNDKALKIKCLDSNYPAYIIRKNGTYGVAVPCAEEVLINEKFTKCRLKNDRLFIENKSSNFLILECFVRSYSYEFAAICAEFVDPGKNGCRRLMLLQSPVEWWKKWKDLLGNRNVERQVYSVIAEMMALKKLYGGDKNVSWSAAQSGSNDIDTPNARYEIKSTVARYGATVTVNSQYQLESKDDKPLYLCFYRMEKTVAGVSIDELKYELVKSGYDETVLEQQLLAQGLEPGSSDRAIRYQCLESRIYEIDDNFPKITKKSFKCDKIPDGILGLTYTVDLDSEDYKNW